MRSERPMAACASSLPPHTSPTLHPPLYFISITKGELLLKGLLSFESEQSHDLQGRTTTDNNPLFKRKRAERKRKKKTIKKTFRKNTASFFLFTVSYCSYCHIWRKCASLSYYSSLLPNT